MEFTWVDLVIIGIVFFSAIVSLLRGFVKEVISLASWVLAFWVSVVFSSQLAPLLPASIEVPSIRLAVAFVVLFLLTLIVGAVINFLLSQLVKKTGLSGTDRSVGMIFGIVRGVLLVTILVLLGGLTPMPQDPWWQDSVLIGYFEKLAVWAQDMLPAEVAEHFQFS